MLYVMFKVVMYGMSYGPNMNALAGNGVFSLIFRKIGVSK